MEEKKITANPSVLEELKQIDLRQWTTGKEAVELLHCSNRQFRKAKEDYNDRYDGKKQKTYIVHSQQGYRKTGNTKEILNCIAKEKKKLRKQFKKLSDTEEAIARKNQITIDEVSTDGV